MTSASEQVRTLYVLDGSYYIFRAFHAIRDMSNSRGLPTNGLFAFTNMLLNVIRDQRPDLLAVAFDPPGGSFREELDPEYKANRDEMPEDLVPQMPYFREIVRALQIPILEVPGFEADDVIGTLVRRGEREGIRVVILSGDKDLYQLLDEHTEMVDSMRDRRVTLPDVLARFQVPPERVPDVLALAGDTSDNIPGCPGVGEKTAGKLIAEFGSLEGLYENLDQVSGPKRKENLANFREQAPKSRALATIRTDVPIDLDPAALRLSAPDFQAFEKLCVDLEFRRFPKMVRELFADEAAEESRERTAAADYRTVTDRAALDAVVADVRRAGRLSIDLETTSLDPIEAEIVGWALAWTPGEAVYVPVGHRDLMDGGRQLDAAEVVEVLRELLEDADFPKIAQNAKYELRVLHRHGVALRGVVHDPMLASYLLDPNRRRTGLDALALDHLNHRMIAFEDVAGKGRQQKTFDMVPIDEATAYAAEDADMTLRLADVLGPLLEGADMTGLLREVELPVSDVLARMENAGVAVDREQLQALSIEFAERLDALEGEIHEVAGRPFLINSHRQLAEILFEELGLPVQKKTKSGPSTDQSVLETLRPMHPLPALILDYRQLAKLRSTYVDALPSLIHPVTGRVHTTFNQAVAATGRLSSSNPNLQNIPIRTVEGRRIRAAFVAPPGRLLLAADYSQIELRLLAHLSGEPVLLEAFRQGEDVHRRTAAEVFEVDSDAVTREQRAAAKTINFGVIYGMGAHRLAGELGIDRKEAAAWIERYFQRISKVQPYFDALVEKATRLGWAETITGRRRPVPELHAGGRHRALGERLAVNTPIQGSAADLIKIAMIRIDRRLRESDLDAVLVLQVHDELVFELGEEVAEELAALVREEMEGAMALDVPLRVDVGTGRDWSALK